MNSIPARQRCRKHPSQDEVLARFQFDPINGNLIFKERPRSHFKTDRAWNAFNRRRAGTVAGTIVNGYVMVGIDGVNYRAHRLIWIMHHGDIPDGMCIDHIDGNRRNNRLSNLKLVAFADNAKNLGPNPKNTSGYPGVHRHSQSGRWSVTIRCGGTHHYLGLFADLDMAKMVARRFYKKHGFSERHVNGRKN